MPVCAMPNSDGFLAVVPELEVTSCSGYVMVSAEEYDFVMAYTQITSSEMATYFAGGFALVFVFGFLQTYGIKAALKVIRLI
ncbi:single-stranded DNA-binding protein [Vibrio tasmaniensis]|nr:single-stranded DNA-binding protein [Vibrio tasmaniensis]